MSEMRFKLSGMHVLVGLAVVAALVVVKIATLGESSDPKLHEAIVLELHSELGGQVGQELKNLDTKDDAKVATFLERADPDAIKLHSASVSKPLLSVGSKVEAVVRVEYSLPGRSPQTVYWRFDHSTIAGWRYRGRSLAVSYYLNFI